MPYSSKPQMWFWVLAIIFLLWNLMGIGAWSTEMAAPDIMMEQMTEQQQELYQSRPGWYMYVYGIAVFAGLLACIMLLFKRKLAVILSLVSLFAVIITTSFNFFNGSWGIINTSDKFFFLSVPLLSICLWLFARSAASKAWLR
ncbi:MAG: hypothetical protein ABJN73_08245 [Nonlabens ulvanivorans]|uniref:Uncharacterized protein n=3 Tax=Nonlabens ulvanivorans TaxID=906888 RepID=A0A084JTT0_NONUL|nr:hypothetical protein [Nonlabens ulvanivorans]KEZ92364.1 hypothetical protein IL45_09440 [Nonlabens ulvanivorans]PRX15198.1 hypothetical protein LY02_00413 [Nonlabens ulvanivorans]WOI22449.1 hypothetical protein R1T42_12325 [Nonlabens ulvanivorans]